MSETSTSTNNSNANLMNIINFQKMQIEMLEQKLQFTKTQVEERDRQLDHYKQLVETLQGLLCSSSAGSFSEVAMDDGPEAFPFPPRKGSSKSQQAQVIARSALKTAPNSPKKGSIKGRKTVSFSEDILENC